MFYCSNNKILVGNGLFVITKELLRDNVIAISKFWIAHLLKPPHGHKQQQLTCRQPELCTLMVKVPRYYQAGSWSIREDCAELNECEREREKERERENFTGTVNETRDLFTVQRFPIKDYNRPAESQTSGPGT